MNSELSLSTEDTKFLDLAFEEMKISETSLDEEPMLEESNDASGSDFCYISEESHDESLFTIEPNETDDDLEMDPIKFAHKYSLKSELDESPRSPEVVTMQPSSEKLDCSGLFTSSLRKISFIPSESTGSSAWECQVLNESGGCTIPLKGADCKNWNLLVLPPKTGIKSEEQVPEFEELKEITKSCQSKSPLKSKGRNKKSKPSKKVSSKEDNRHWSIILKEDRESMSKMEAEEYFNDLMIRGEKAIEARKPKNTRGRPQIFKKNDQKSLRAWFKEFTTKTMGKLNIDILGIIVSLTIKERVWRLAYYQELIFYSKREM